MVRVVLSVLIISSLIGCGSVNKNGAAGGLLGGALGAGTGALIASSISNGDVAASALLGGAVGVPIGIALGVAYSAYDPKVQEQRLLDQYVENQYSIIDQEAEIQRLREQVIMDAPRNVYYNLGARKPFHGSTLGSRQ
jgi:hypothetical protein